MQDEIDTNANGEEEVFVAEPDEGFYEDDYLEDMPGWPKPIGILSIVFGSISVVCGGFGVAMMFVMPSMMGAAVGDDPLPPTMTPGLVQIVLMVASVLINVLLVVGGITCLSRKIAARYMHLVYGIGMIVLSIAGVMFQFQLMAQMDLYVQDYPDNPISQGYNRPMQLGSALAMTALSLAWPIFCLAWFGLVKKTEDDMTGGLLEAAA
jgi:hypothetical protein